MSTVVNLPMSTAVQLAPQARYPRLLDRVSYVLASLSADGGVSNPCGTGIFLRTESAFERTCWIVRRDTDGALVALLPHLGDYMRVAV